MEVSILGTKYEVSFVEMDGLDGETDFITKEIKISPMKREPKKHREHLIKSTLRHELIHAFLHESGLDVCSSSADAWARNEEMIDFFALQFPKIMKAMKKAGAL